MKAKKTNATNNTVSKSTNGGLTFIDVDKICANREVTDKFTKYTLYNGIELVIVGTDKDYDYGALKLFGLSVNVTFRETKNGYRMMYPSYKKNNGDYVNLVTSFNSDMNGLVNKILEYHYKGLV